MTFTGKPSTANKILVWDGTKWVESNAGSGSGGDNGLSRRILNNGRLAKGGLTQATTLFRNNLDENEGFRSIVTFENIAFTAVYDSVLDTNSLYFMDSLSGTQGLVTNGELPGTASEAVSSILYYSQKDSNLNHSVPQNYLIIIRETSVQFAKLSVTTNPSTGVAEPEVDTFYSTALTLDTNSKATILNDVLYITYPTSGDIKYVNILNTPSFVTGTMISGLTGIAGITSGAPFEELIAGTYPYTYSYLFVSTNTGIVRFLKDGGNGLFDQTTLTTETNAQNCRALMFDGKYLWAYNDNGTLSLFSMDGTLLRSWGVGTSNSFNSPTLVFDGMCTWISTSQFIQKISIENGIIQTHNISQGNNFLSTFGVGNGLAINSAGDIFLGIKNYDADFFGNALASGISNLEDSIYTSFKSHYNFSHSNGANPENVTVAGTILSELFFPNPADVASNTGSVKSLWLEIVVNNPTVGGTLFDINLLINGTPVETIPFTETGVGTFYVRQSMLEPFVNGDELSVSIDKNPSSPDAMDWTVRFSIDVEFDTPETLVTSIGGSEYLQSFDYVSSFFIPFPGTFYISSFSFSFDVNSPAGDTNFDIDFLHNGVAVATVPFTETVGSHSFPNQPVGITADLVNDTLEFRIRTASDPQTIDWSNFITTFKYSGNFIPILIGPNHKYTVKEIAINYNALEAASNTALALDLLIDGVVSQSFNFTELVGVNTVNWDFSDVPIFNGEDLSFLLRAQDGYQVDLAWADHSYDITYYNDSVELRNYRKMAYPDQELAVGDFKRLGVDLNTGPLYVKNNLVSAHQKFGKFVFSGTSINGAAVDLVGDEGSLSTALALDINYSYALRITCVASLTSARAMFIHDVLAYSNGVAVIDLDNFAFDGENGTGWTFVITASGPNLVLTFTGEVGENVRANATVEYIKVENA